MLRAFALISLVSVPAFAVTLTKVSETTPWPGVIVRKYRTASPATDAYAVFVSLCTNGVHVDATRAPSGLQTAGTWAGSRGVQLATNGDFYLTGPNHVYGAAVGDGVPWPSAMTGYDPAYASGWYYKHAGWFAFRWDGVEFNHTQYVKNHPNGRTLSGWQPTTVTSTFPDDTLALVSGFPELVTEGTQVTCVSPTDPTCFTDRSDMRARNPRTAMGLTADQKTFILLVVDGRTTTSAGMYGSELAETMKKLGAWQAFNIDGGGSTQLWQKGVGVVNAAAANGGGTTVRGVMNHWGIFAGTNVGQTTRPGHCVTASACEVIPPTGGTIDDSSACFATYGPPSTWRTASAGEGGSLRWTNATSSSAADNWAWWRLELAAEGDYRVEYSSTAAYGQFTGTRYEVFANGVKRVVTSNQASAAGWRSLGTFHFAAGGNQYVRVYDNNSALTVASGTHLQADAVRLVPASPICGDGTCNGTETCSSCAMDCGACPTCGDGTCNGAETCSTCAMDCGACCGNGACDDSESCSSCAMDCGACPTCGDGSCNGAESCSSCAMDCGACCGDGTCGADETCTTCAQDCGACELCGDGACGGDETCSSCVSDCGACEVDGGAVEEVDAGAPPDQMVMARGCSTGAGLISVLVLVWCRRRGRALPLPA